MTRPTEKAFWDGFIEGFGQASILLAPLVFILLLLRQCL